jgi:hypothetical protein
VADHGLCAPDRGRREVPPQIHRPPTRPRCPPTTGRHVVFVGGRMPLAHTARNACRHAQMAETLSTRTLRLLHSILNHSVRHAQDGTK